jgi:hypothetical protein
MLERFWRKPECVCQSQTPTMLLGRMGETRPGGTQSSEVTMRIGPAVAGEFGQRALAKQQTGALKTVG